MKQPTPKAVIHGKHEQIVFNPHEVHAQSEQPRPEPSAEEWPSDGQQAVTPEIFSEATESK